MQSALIGATAVSTRQAVSARDNRQVGRNAADTAAFSHLDSSEGARGPVMITLDEFYKVGLAHLARIRSARCASPTICSSAVRSCRRLAREGNGAQSLPVRQPQCDRYRI